MIATSHSLVIILLNQTLLDLEVDHGTYNLELNLSESTSAKGKMAQVEATSGSTTIGSVRFVFSLLMIPVPLLVLKMAAWYKCHPVL